MSTLNLSLEIEKKDWIELVTKYNDLFRTDHCGYWLRGVERNADGWLVWEDDEQHDYDQEPNKAEAITAFTSGDSLPDGWFRFDTKFAQFSWAMGVREYGRRWYEEGDAETYDVVIQLALFGNVRYR